MEQPNFSEKNQTKEDVIERGKESFWVFGYGSLCWNPGFEYQESVCGFVKGFSRRFWQGNTTHRGTDSKPGRVATLIEDKEGLTWGKAFLISADNNAALPYLTTRECQLGGYRTYTVNFHPRPSFLQEDTTSLPSTSMTCLVSTSLTCLVSTNLPSTSLPTTILSDDKKDALLYIAVPENRHWLGAAPLPEIAKQILECEGSSGSNAEYLLRLADFMREEIPEALDDHLFSLERLVRKFAADMKVCLNSLMGERSEDKETKAVVPTYAFASRIPEKKLRCVNM